jgi:hypothetical protein
MERSVFENREGAAWAGRYLPTTSRSAASTTSRSAALEAAALAASYSINDGVGVQINVPGAEEEKPRWAVRV